MTDVSAQPIPESGDAARRLEALMNVSPQGENAFVAQSEDIGTPAVFGGQVLGQALVAASRTVASDRPVHSLHAYFLLPGRHQEIDYGVERVRDGGSFSTRRVTASQEGEAIFTMMASFQRSEGSIDRHDPMPSVPGPDGIASEAQSRAAVADRMPAAMRDKALLPRGIEYRPIAGYNLVNPKPREARNAIWLKASGPVSDNPLLHRAMLAYASDHGLLMTATYPHGLSLLRRDVQLASLDHVMWFHRDFRIDDWLLYDVRSSTAQGSRALCHGAIYNRAGQLVATTVQEGLMRPRAEKP